MLLMRGGGGGRAGGLSLGSLLTWGTGLTVNPTAGGSRRFQGKRFWTIYCSVLLSTSAADIPLLECSNAPGRDTEEKCSGGQEGNANESHKAESRGRGRGGLLKEWQPGSLANREVDLVTGQETVRKAGPGEQRPVAAKGGGKETHAGAGLLARRPSRPPRGIC